MNDNLTELMNSLTDEQIILLSNYLKSFSSAMNKLINISVEMLEKELIYRDIRDRKRLLKLGKGN